MASHLKKSTIVLTAGGTGGHMFPALALAQKLKQENIDIHLITDHRGVAYLPKNLDFSVHILPLTGLGKPSLWHRFVGFITLIPSLIMCLYALATLRVRCVVGFGGYPAFPCLLAARFLRIPVWLQEQNAYFGRVNRYFASYAEGIALGFAQTKGIAPALKNKTHVTGIPVRQEMYEVAEKSFRADSSLLKIVVVGGSQGARIFAELLPQALNQLSPEYLQKLSIVQQCRVEDQKPLIERYQELPIRFQVETFIRDMAVHLSDAGLLISRAGASTTGEVIATARPALFIPLPGAMDDHQFFNAETVARQGGAWVVRESKMTPDRLAHFLRHCVDKPERLQHAHVALKGMRSSILPTDRLFQLIESKIKS